MKNYKTTSAGLVMIIGGIASMAYSWKHLNPETITAHITGILGGIGLLLAKDHDADQNNTTNEES